MSKLWCVRPTTLDNELKPVYDSKMEHFFSKEIVSLGLPLTGDLTGLKSHQIKDLLRQKYNRISDSMVGQYICALERFIFGIDNGDYIILPQRPNQFSIGKITDDYKYESSSDTASGYPHIRQIKWLKVGLARTVLSMELRKSLGSPSPVFGMNQYYSEIQKIVEDGNPQIIENKTVNVTYPPRPDHTVAFKVPSNMKKQEAERLSNFIKTIFYQ